MTVLSVAYPLFRVSRDSSGGAEQILYLLDRGLMQLGHHSLVIAAEGSRVSGTLIETSASHEEITNELRQEAQRDHLSAIEQVLSQEPVDVIHFHGLDFYRYLPAATVNQIATLHLPCAWYPQDVFRLEHVQLVCVSESQAKSAPVQDCLRVVPNGIDTAAYRPAETRRKHLLWLGRICPEKAPHIALEVAHELDLPVIIAGPVHQFRDHQKYFSEKVQPLLNHKRCYVGPVGFEAKLRLLQESICLLIPSLVEETSSLVAMEAIASGTPVVAYRTGALPELIEDGITGFIVESSEEMVNAVARVNQLLPEVCRKTARKLFDAGRMISDYLSLYESL